MTFTPPMARKEGRSFGRQTHWYVDANGLKIPGVTTIIGDGVPKPALMRWGINTVAEHAVDHWDELGLLTPSERLKQLKASPYAQRDAAANRGTEIHDIGSRLIHGTEVEVPDELAGHVEAYTAFLDAFDPQPVAVERPCVNYTIGYAGTFDLVADMGGTRWLLDLKTSKGVYGDTALQLAAYRSAEFLIAEDGSEQPMPAVERCAVVHIRADGADLVPLVVDDSTFLDFRYAARVARWATETSKAAVLPAVTPGQLPLGDIA